MKEKKGFVEAELSDEMAQELKNKTCKEGHPMKYAKEIDGYYCPDCAGSMW